jgi:hypothetical protein
VRRPWFKAEPVDETFFDAAPQRLGETFEIPRPAADVWAELTADNPLSWCRILDRIEWTSPRPFGVGTTRTVTSGMRVANPVNRRILGTLLTDTRKHFRA